MTIVQLAERIRIQVTTKKALRPPGVLMAGFPCRTPIHELVERAPGCADVTCKEEHYIELNRLITR